MSGASKGDSRFDDAYRFALAGLVLADSEKNREHSLKLLSKLDRKVSANKRKETISSVKSLFYRSTLSYKIYAVFMRIVLGMVPVKKTRKALKRKFNI
jgi:hypothetical protein